MISLRTLVEGMSDDRVACDTHGTLLEIPIGDISPAVLLVSEVTEAVKVVEGGLVVASVDRAGTSAVVAFALQRQVLERLGDQTMGAADLVDAVRASGYDWEIIPMPSVP